MFVDGTKIEKLQPSSCMTFLQLIRAIPAADELADAI